MAHRNPFDLTVGRRGFLKAAGLGAGAMMLHGGLLGRAAMAQDAPDHKFVFAYFGGGWDTLLCLDPRDPGVFTAERIRETNIQLAWDRLPASFGRDMVSFSDSPITFGPAIGDFQRHYQKACVVRGMSMDTLTHEVGRRYMLTGQMPAGLQASGSSIATRIIAQQGDHSPIPNLVSRSETYNKGLPSFASGLAVNGAGDLVLTLQRLPGAPRQSVFDRLNAYRARRADCDPSALNHTGFFEQLRASESKATELIDQGLDRYFNFSAPDNREVAERYGITQRGPAAGGATAGEQAAVAAQALKQGVAQCVTISLATNLDTHDESWADDHPESLRSGFNALATLVDDLEEANLMSKTTIVVFSEFGRTPLLNTRDGRDHSLSSCAMLIGAGVPANTVVGGTNDVGLGPLPIDPLTGQTLENGGTTLTPANVLASVMQSAGYDPSALRENGLPCLMA